MLILRKGGCPVPNLFAVTGLTILTAGRQTEIRMATFATSTSATSTATPGGNDYE
jgi:hypothetical protein